MAQQAGADASEASTWAWIDWWIDGTRERGGGGGGGAGGGGGGCGGGGGAGGGGSINSNERRLSIEPRWKLGRVASARSRRSSESSSCARKSTRACSSARKLERRRSSARNSASRFALSAARSCAVSSALEVRRLIVAPRCQREGRQRGQQLGVQRRRAAPTPTGVSASELHDLASKDLLEPPLASSEAPRKPISPLLGSRVRTKHSKSHAATRLPQGAEALLPPLAHEHLHDRLGGVAQAHPLRRAVGDAAARHPLRAPAHRVRRAVPPRRPQRRAVVRRRQGLRLSVDMDACHFMPAAAAIAAPRARTRSRGRSMTRSGGRSRARTRTRTRSSGWRTRSGGRTVGGS